MQDIRRGAYAHHADGGYHVMEEQEHKWVILERQNACAPWVVRRHQGGTIYKFATLDKAIGAMPRKKRRDGDIKAEREDRYDPKS